MQDESLQRLVDTLIPGQAVLLCPPRLCCVPAVGLAQPGQDLQQTGVAGDVAADRRETLPAFQRPSGAIEQGATAECEVRVGGVLRRARSGMKAFNWSSHSRGMAAAASPKVKGLWEQPKAASGLAEFTLSARSSRPLTSSCSTASDL